MKTPFFLKRCREKLTSKKRLHSFHLKNNMLLALNKMPFQKFCDRTNNPLISVLIPTYNKGKILTQRSIPSVLRQTYQNFEIIIVGDHCTDNTQEMIENFNDKRIIFCNLPTRGNYPLKLEDRWRVSGTFPRNKAIELSSGEWLAPLDDDDEFSNDHLEVLLKHALSHKYDMVYGKVLMETRKNEWVELGSYPLEHAKICHLSVLYSSSLKSFKYDIDAWRYQEPGDWNMWRRMKESGIRIGFTDKIVGKHYLEKQQKGG